ncbi:hypothetical protein D7V86_10315 [bacterium D16-51]|nr:hypothetical protein D7V96_10660 [bacterium D16-59]RKI60051.1 hypothetical protein D7V86_10315 [bacterium D16-51]
MASGDLFRGFPVRFSMKKTQHVKMLEKFEDRRLNGGKAKNQIIMDALEMYYNALESGSGASGDEAVTVQVLEQRLLQFRQEFRDEMMQELLRIFATGGMAWRQAAASAPIGEPEREELEEEGVADISGMPDIMDKIMGWSENS